MEIHFDEEYKKFLKKCRKIEAKVLKAYPEKDPDIVHLIVRNLIMPKKWGKRFFLRKIGGTYVP